MCSLTAHSAFFSVLACVLNSGRSTHKLSIKMNSYKFCLNVFDVYPVSYGGFEVGFGIGVIKLAIGLIYLINSFLLVLWIKRQVIKVIIIIFLLNWYRIALGFLTFFLISLYKAIPSGKCQRCRGCQISDFPCIRAGLVGQCSVSVIMYRGIFIFPAFNLSSLLVLNSSVDHSFISFCFPV